MCVGVLCVLFVLASVLVHIVCLSVSIFVFVSACRFCLFICLLCVPVDALVLSLFPSFFLSLFTLFSLFLRVHGFLWG